MDSSATLRSTVALSNWKRLSNAPIDLAKPVAVQWRDFIVAIDIRANDVLLYNPKWNMWSRLPSLTMSAVRPAEGCPLVTYENKLLILGENGKIYEFLPESGRWEMCKSLDPNINIRRSHLTVALVFSVGDFLLLIYGTGDVKKHPTIGQTQPQFGWVCTTFFKCYNRNFKSWSNLQTLQSNILKADLVSHFSITALDASNIFVSTGHDIHSLQITSFSRSLTDLTNKVPVDTVPITASAPIKAGNQSPNVSSLAPAQTSLQQGFGSTSNPFRGFGFGGLGVRLTTVPPQATQPTETDPVVTAKQLPCPPQQMYTLCVVENSLFAIGGKDSDNQPFSTVYQYDTETDTWKSAGNMCTSRYGVATAIFESENLGDLFVVGGYLGESGQTAIACRITDCCQMSESKKT